MTATDPAIPAVTQTAITSICFACAYYRGTDDDGVRVAHCAAFPLGIPVALTHGLADHRYPIDGDGGVRFRQHPSAEAAARLDLYEKVKGITGTRVAKHTPGGVPHDQSAHGRRAASQANIDRTFRDGGATYDVSRGRLRRSGKAVSPYPERSRKLTPADFASNGIARVRQYMADHADLLEDPEHDVGTWYDNSEDVVWLDVVRTVPTSAQAAEIGKRANQKAYFDLDIMEEIPLGGTGEVTKQEVGRDQDRRRNDRRRHRGRDRSRPGDDAEPPGDRRLIAKHAEHNQDDHGNWARGGGSDSGGPIRRTGPAEAASMALKQMISDDYFSDTRKTRAYIKDRVVRDLADDIYNDLSEAERDALLEANLIDENGLANHPSFMATKAMERAIDMESEMMGTEMGYRTYVDDILPGGNGLALLGWGDFGAAYNAMSPGAQSRLVLYALVDQTIGNWAGTALDHDPQALAIQEAALAEFGGNHRSYQTFISEQYRQRTFDPDHPPFDYTERMPRIQRKVLSQTISNSYDRTQAMIRDTVGAGATTVRLHRGMKIPADTTPAALKPVSEFVASTGPTAQRVVQVPASMNPMSSWSLDRGIANEFGQPGRNENGYMISADVPIEAITSSFLTGFGAAPETEFIVNLPDDTVVEWRSAD